MVKIVSKKVTICKNCAIINFSTMIKGYTMNNVEETPVSGTNETEQENGYNVKKDYWESKYPKLPKNLVTAIYIFLAALFYAVGYHYFVATCKFAPGGLPGIIAMIQYKTGVIDSGNSKIDYSTLLMVLVNLPLLIVASKILTKDFAVKTFITSALMAIMMFCLTNFIDYNYVYTIAGTPNVSDVGTRLVGAILGGACSGLSLAFALKVNASTGGADVVGAMLQKKYPHKGVGAMVFAVNGVIMAISIFVYNDDLMPVFLSLINAFANSVTCDFIMQGAKSALKFEVITEHAKEISKEIIEELGHGVTITPAKGMFEHKDKNLLICVIKPRQIAKFQNIIKKYPETFAYVGSVNEIIGKFNRGNRND